MITLKDINEFYRKMFSQKKIEEALRTDVPILPLLKEEQKVILRDRNANP